MKTEYGVKEEEIAFIDFILDEVDPVIMSMPNVENIKYKKRVS